MTPELIALEKRHSWHPFTQMQEWCAPEHEPVALVSGDGAVLRDSRGREYIDGNSSIWTNIHGHRHPKINAAITAQLEQVAHTSFLGYTHPLAIELAAKLVGLWPGGALSRVFFSDNGSTAIEVALKMAIQCWQHRGQERRTQFVAFTNAYHGDTMGATSLGGINAFHGRFSAFRFPAFHVASLEELEAQNVVPPEQIAAVVIEPLIQGAAGMHFWPDGMLARLRAWCDRHGIFLIVDEVMTGFGRTGTMFACEQEGVTPDFAAFAKGLSGGYVPLAATLVREEIYESFLGSYEEMKTFFYGHSFTANPVGCAAALASLAIFEEERVLDQLQHKSAILKKALCRLEGHPNVRHIRQRGFIAAMEVTHADGTPFPWQRQMGQAVCVAARSHGLLTRPIRDTLPIMLPYCVSQEQIEQTVEALYRGVEEATRA